MKVAVCINSTLSLQGSSLEQVRQAMLEAETSGKYVIEASSVSAIQLAASLCGSEDELIAISCGGESSVAALEYALAYGVNSVVHIREIPELVGADSTVMANILANWLKKQSFDLIVCGNASGNGTLPALLAGYLGLPSVPRVDSVRKRDANTLEVRQRLVNGWRQMLALRLPALVTVQAGYFPTKYVSVKRRNWASQNRVRMEVIQPEWEGQFGAKLLSVEVPKPRTKRTALPDARQSAADRLKSMMGGGASKAAKGGNEEEKKIVEGPPEEAVQEIIQFLKKKELLPEKLL